MHTPLSIPVQPILSEPSISDELFAAVTEALRWAWERLRDETELDLMIEEEERINHEIERLLNQRSGGRRRARTLRLFETVQREAQHQGADMSFRNKPDLTFRPKAMPHGVINQDDWGVFVECKIVNGNGNHSPRVYCREGLQKFADGRYASRMSVGLMVAYVRDGTFPVPALRPILEGAYATIAIRARGQDQSVACSLHDRSQLAVPCVNVDVTHLWLDARPPKQVTPSPPLMAAAPPGPAT